MVKVKKNGDETWRLFVSGQDRSFEDLFHTYFKTVCDFGFRLCDDREVVKDFVQEIFVKVWTNREALKEIRCIRSYLFTALRNSIINFHASPRSKGTSIEDAGPDFLLEYSPEELLIGREVDSVNLQKVQAALNTLSARQKECVYLKYYAGLEYDEIAKVMDISVKGCYKLTARAIASLKEWAANNTPPGGKSVHFWFL